MKRAFLIAVLVIAAGTPAHALIVDDTVSALQYAEDQAYHAFMKLKIIEEIALLKQNYDASMRYYNEFKQLNSGGGLFQNIAAKIKTGLEQESQNIANEIDWTFVHTYNTNTSVDKMYQSIDKGITGNIRYAGDGLANVISNRKTGEDIANNAGGLSPKDAANLNAKAQGIQIQMLAQIHEDNLRLIQLQSMQLADQARRQQSESQSIDSIRQGLKSRAPGYQEPLDDDQGEAQ